MRTTSVGALVGWLLLGLVVGWSIRPVAVAVGAVAPQVVWLQAAALYLVAAVMAWVARATHTAIQQGRRRLEPHEAVNRLVLAKACALVGAAVTGGYLGYALTWVGVQAELAGERVTLSVVAAGGALLATAASLLVERACRVRDDDEEP